MIPKLPLLAQLEGLADTARERLAGYGFHDVDHVREHVAGSQNGGPVLAELLGVSDRNLQEALGWRDWPKRKRLRFPRHWGPRGLRSPDPRTLARLDRAGELGTPDRESLPDHSSLIPFYDREPRDQGQAGTCAAFALIAAHDGQERMRGRKAPNGNPVKLSEAYLYHFVKLEDGFPDTDGTTLRAGTSALVKYGACLESTHPYKSDRRYLRTRPPQRAIAEARNYRASGRTMLEPRDVREICKRIAEGQPVALGLPLFASTLNNLRFHREGRMLMRLGPNDSLRGGHAMAATAFVTDDWLASHDMPSEVGGGAFLLLNSWGRWALHNPIAKALGGAGGYAICPFAYVEQYGWEAATTTVAPRNEPRAKTTRRELVLARTAREWWRDTSAQVADRAHRRLRDVYGVQKR